MKVVLYDSDRFCYSVYTEKEAEEMFGWTVEQDLESFVEVPEELVNEYREVCSKFWKLNRKLRDLKKENEEQI